MRGNENRGLAKGNDKNKTAQQPNSPKNTHPQAKPGSQQKSITRQQPVTKQQITTSTPEKTEKVTEKMKEGYWSKLDRTEIRKIKTYIYVIEIIVIIIIILNAMYESIVIEPFYFPIGYLLMFILFMVFLISLEGVWFKFIMIKTSKSFNKRSKLIKDYQNSAQSALVTSIVVLIILLSLNFLPIVSDALKTEDTYKFTNIDPEQLASFEDQDLFGITHSNKINFDSNNTVELKLHVRQLKNNPDEEDITEKEIGNYDTIDYSLDSPNYQLGYSPNKEYNFFIINIGNQNLSGKYVVEREISKPFTFNIILFMILFIITSLCWLVYLSVIKKKYRVLHDEKVAQVTKRYAVKPYTIEDVFLIYFDGTLLSHQTRRIKPLDNDILSGMLTAIKDFIRDVFKPSTPGLLNELKFGRFKILIEHGEYAFLAVVVGGTPPKDLRNRMKRTTAQINKQFLNELKNYKGQAAKLAPVKNIIYQQLIGPEDITKDVQGESDVAWNNKGVILTKLGKYNEAIDSFDKALEYNPGVSNIWLNRGIALVKLNEFEEAMDCFDRALQLDPNNTTAKHRRNKCWYKWKLIEGREKQVMGSSSSRARRRAESDYGSRGRYDDEYERPVPEMEFVGSRGGGAVLAGNRAGTSADYYDQGAQAGGYEEEPPPRCPDCGQPLRFVDEYETWYCEQCDLYPYDE